MLKNQIEQDLKAALLGGDTLRVSTLRNIKSVILYEEVSKKQREPGLSDDDIVIVLMREAKKRQESAELYTKGGRQNMAENELTEKSIIEAYLPKQLNDNELIQVIEEVIAELKGEVNLGTVISKVKTKVNGTADGSRIAQYVKTRIK